MRKFWFVFLAFCLTAFLIACDQGTTPEETTVSTTPGAEETLSVSSTDCGTSSTSESTPEADSLSLELSSLLSERIENVVSALSMEVDYQLDSTYEESGKTTTSSYAYSAKMNVLAKTMKIEGVLDGKTVIDALFSYRSDGVTALYTPYSFNGTQYYKSSVIDFSDYSLDDSEDFSDLFTFEFASGEFSRLSENSIRVISTIGSVTSTQTDLVGEIIHSTGYSEEGQRVVMDFTFTGNGGMEIACHFTLRQYGIGSSSFKMGFDSVLTVRGLGSTPGFKFPFGSVILPPTSTDSLALVQDVFKWEGVCLPSFQFYATVDLQEGYYQISGFQLLDENLNQINRDSLYGLYIITEPGTYYVSFTGSPSKPFTPILTWSATPPEVEQFASPEEAEGIVFSTGIHLLEMTLPAGEYETGGSSRIVAILKPDLSGIGKNDFVGKILLSEGRYVLRYNSNGITPFHFDLSCVTYSDYLDILHPTILPEGEYDVLLEGYYDALCFQVVCPGPYVLVEFSDSRAPAILGIRWSDWNQAWVNDYSFSTGDGVAILDIGQRDTFIVKSLTTEPTVYHLIVRSVEDEADQENPPVLSDEFTGSSYVTDSGKRFGPDLFAFPVEVAGYFDFVTNVKDGHGSLKIEVFRDGTSVYAGYSLVFLTPGTYEIRVTASTDYCEYDLRTEFNPVGETEIFSLAPSPDYQLVEGTVIPEGFDAYEFTLDEVTLLQFGVTSGKITIYSGESVLFANLRSNSERTLSPGTYRIVFECNPDGSEIYGSKYYYCAYLKFSSAS